MAPTFDTSRCMIKPVSDRRAVFVFEKEQSPVVVIYEDLDYAGSLLESPGRPHRRRCILADRAGGRPHRGLRSPTEYGVLG